MTKSFRNLIKAGFLFSGSVFLLRCGHDQAPSTALFNGECRVEVKSKVAGSEILMDGVPVGHDAALLQVPCGERLVEVHKKGFVPFHEYYKVEKSMPLSVNVNLSPRKSLTNEALSMALVEKVRGPKVAAAPVVSKSGAAADSGAPSPGASAGQPKWDTVDDWR